MPPIMEFIIAKGFIIPAIGPIIVANGFSIGGCCVLARLLALPKLKLAMAEMRRLMPKVRKRSMNLRALSLCCAASASH